MGSTKDSIIEAEADASCREHAHPDDETARVVDHDAERKLCFKFDIRILPVLAIMCAFSPSLSLSCFEDANCLDLFNALDKGNLGNAKTKGLDKGEY